MWHVAGSLAVLRLVGTSYAGVLQGAAELPPGLPACFCSPGLPGKRDPVLTTLLPLPLFLQPGELGQLKQLLEALHGGLQGCSEPLAAVALSACLLQLRLRQGAAAARQAAADPSGSQQEASLAGYLREVRGGSRHLGCCWRCALGISVACQAAHAQLASPQHPTAG